jgi:hypothetical protein
VFLVFTFWLYLLGFVFVLGAELNSFLEQRAHAAQPTLAEPGLADPALAQPSLPRPSLGGRLLGLVGLLMAALLLRGAASKERADV